MNKTLKPPTSGLFYLLEKKYTVYNTNDRDGHTTNQKSEKTTKRDNSDNPCHSSLGKPLNGRSTELS